VAAKRCAKMQMHRRPDDYGAKYSYQYGSGCHHWISKRSNVGDIRRDVYSGYLLTWVACYLFNKSTTSTSNACARRSKPSIEILVTQRSSWET
jgi:hypothetical protein